jgi:hypothetical protein
VIFEDPSEEGCCALRGGISHLDGAIQCFRGAIDALDPKGSDAALLAKAFRSLISIPKLNFCA